MDTITNESKADERQNVFDAASLFAEKKASVVNIISEGSANGRSSYSVGSGFFISADKNQKSCEIATANHSVVPSRRMQLDSIQVKLENGKTYSATLKEQDLANDLAYLTIEGVDDPEQSCPALDISRKALGSGEAAFRISRMPKEAEMHQGKFSKTIDRKDLDLILLDGEDPERQLHKFDLYNTRDRAFGGAPVLNEKGEVIAVNAGGLSGTQIVAVPAQKLKPVENKQK